MFDYMYGAPVNLNAASTIELCVIDIRVKRGIKSQFVDYDFAASYVSQLLIELPFLLGQLDNFAFELNDFLVEVNVAQLFNNRSNFFGVIDNTHGISFDCLTSKITGLRGFSRRSGALQG
ncbi:MAG: hypothetical protein U1C96_01325 [Gallionella sp.]|nr:hypothetical protein [Gallionella sp.]